MKKLICFAVKCILFLTSITLAQSGLDSGLVAYYPFNGNANDESENNNHGTINGAMLVPDKFGNENSAFQFDGVDDLIYIGYSPNFDFSQEKQISYGLWLYIDQLDSEIQTPLGKDSYCSQFAFAIDISPQSRVRAWIHGGPCWILLESPTLLSTNKWYQIYVTANDNHLKLYINDQALESNISNVTWDPYIGHTFIGAWGGFPPTQIEYFEGIIDEVRIYNRKLSDEEISELYDQFTGTTNVYEDSELLNEIALEQNFPNPFNPTTKIKYEIPNSSYTKLSVYDVLGNEIDILVSEEKPAGIYENTWNAEKLPSGVYFYRLQAENFIETKKMVLMK